MLTNSRNTPIEAFERAFPMRVLRYTLRRGSGGAGFSPGGEGIERDVLMLEDVTVSLITERRDTQPWGLPLIATKASKSLGGSGLALWCDERVGKVFERRRSGADVSGRSQLFGRSPVRKGPEHGDRSTSIGDLDRLPGLDEAQELARPLSQLTNPDCRRYWSLQ